MLYNFLWNDIVCEVKIFLNVSSKYENSEITLKELHISCIALLPPHMTYIYRCIHKRKIYMNAYPSDHWPTKKKTKNNENTEYK